MLAAAASSSPSCVDPVDIATSTVLADYKWLPSCRHAAFQAALEQEEGIARVYFAAEVDLAVAVTNSSSSSRGGSTQHGRTTHRSVSLYGMDEDRGILGDDSQPQEQQSVETVRAVVLMTWTALYICDTDATVLRCVPVADVDGVGVIRDTWLWLRIVHPHRTLTLLQEPPLAFGAAANGDGMDTVFRLASENESPLAVQRVFLRVLSAALMHTLAAPSRAPHSSSASSSILTRTTSADFVRFFHDFSLVRLPSRMPSTMTCPPALPLLRYSAVWIDVSNPHSLIEHMLLRHQLVCGRPPPIRYDVLKDPVARWSDAAIEEGRRRQQDPYYSPIPPPITHARSQPALHDARSSASPLRLAESPLPRVSRREGVAPEVPASSCGSNTSPARRRGLPASLPPPSPRSTVNAEVVPPLTTAPSPCVPVEYVASTAIVPQFPQQNQQLTLSRHLTGAHTGSMENATPVRNTATTPSSASVSAVTWDPMIERMLLHEGRREPSDRNYARHISHDILPRGESSMRVSPASLSSCERVSRVVRDIDEEDDPRCSPASSGPFTACPPLRM